MQTLLHTAAKLSMFAFLVSAVHALNSSFDVRETTIEHIHIALNTGRASCRGIVESFLARIEAYNPALNALLSLNPDALSIADSLDVALAGGNTTSSLFCIPVLLKDNYDTTDMKTTGGCLSLAGLQPTTDAPVVSALKRAGAIILGKTNMHELALEGLSVSSLGGQTINPYDLTRTPGGSSGGTGAAIAASFSVFGTGTDTVNSLRSPASANSLFSMRPTRGLISRAGIMPISFTQDAVGPIARNLNDLAVALTVMASVGFDPRDNATDLIPVSPVARDYSTALHGGNLRGLRLGVLEGFFNRTASDETTPVNEAIDATISAFVAAGATIIPIESPIYNATAISSLYDVQKFEYRQQMDTYLSGPSLRGNHPSTLNEVYTSGKFLVIPDQYSYVRTALSSSTENATYPAIKLGIQNLTTAVLSTFNAYSLTALIYPEQKNLVVKLGASSQSGRNGALAAVTGLPVVTVPAGFSPATPEAPIGVPIGMEILGMPWSEEKLLNIAKLLTDRRRVRRPPASSAKAAEGRRLDKMPSIVPNRSNIPAVYPVGTL
ncbi:hypothetical protein MMC07_007869 [Pseudocyphellaria aurata]|nr:hypothetical protein [Pseudocyphellaria aurata]